MSHQFFLGSSVHWACPWPARSSPLHCTLAECGEPFRVTIHKSNTHTHDLNALSKCIQIIRRARYDVCFCVTLLNALFGMLLTRRPLKIASTAVGSAENGNWSSFQLANSAPPLSVTGSAIAPSARITLQCHCACGVKDYLSQWGCKLVILVL